MKKIISDQSDSFLCVTPSRKKESSTTANKEPTYNPFANIPMPMNEDIVRISLKDASPKETEELDMAPYLF